MVTLKVDVEDEVGEGFALFSTDWGVVFNFGELSLEAVVALGLRT